MRCEVCRYHEDYQGGWCFHKDKNSQRDAYALTCMLFEHQKMSEEYQQGYEDGQNDQEEYHEAMTDDSYDEGYSEGYAQAKEELGVSE